MTILKPKEGGRTWIVYETDEGLAIEQGNHFYHLTNASNAQRDYINLKNVLLRLPT